MSIGAINSALIAGNAREHRLSALENFWSTVSSRKVWAHTPEGDIFHDLRNHPFFIRGQGFQRVVVLLAKADLFGLFE